MVPYVAYLRIYEPLSSFPVAEAARWSAYAQEATGTDTVTVLRTEQHNALAAALRARALTPVRLEEGAYVLREGDDIFICPDDLRLRSWLAMASLIDDIGDARLRLIAPGALEHPDPDFLRWRKEHPEAMPHIQQSRWQVPPAWFLLVDEADREIYPLDGASGSATVSVRFRSSMAQARRRCARAFSVVRRTFDEEPIVQVVAELGSWLESFHPHSRVEVDYAGVARLLGRDISDLSADTSAADVTRAVNRLAAGDLAAATSAYERLVDRWRGVRLAEHAN